MSVKKKKKKVINEHCNNIKNELIYNINNFNANDDINNFTNKNECIINSIKKINFIIDKVSDNTNITNYISKNDLSIDSYEN